MVDLTGEGVYGDLVLDRAIDYTAGFGRRLRSLVFWAVDEVDRNADWFNDPHTALGFQNWIATGLLWSQHHTYTDRLAEDGGFVAPRDVKRVADYVRANADRPIGLTHMVAVAGVPARTLRKHFHDFYGLAPMAYLRKVRYERVRTALEEGATAQSIADIAWRSGFRHMGRFAVGYQRLFGERPSETLRRGRPKISSRARSAGGKYRNRRPR